MDVLLTDDLFVWLIDDDWPDNFKCLSENLLTYSLTDWLTDSKFERLNGMNE